MAKRHNHVTRQIKARGLCPACDEYRRLHPSSVAAFSSRSSGYDDGIMDAFLSTFIASEIAASFDTSPSFDYGSSSSFDSGSSSSFDSGSFGGDGGSF
jgi:hypothetical protein